MQQTLITSKRAIGFDLLCAEIVLMGKRVAHIYTNPNKFESQR